MTATGRGQTTLDFAVGTSVFLIAVAFVLAFVPGMFQPFAAGASEETVAADRVADHLVETVLVERDSPYRLDRDCTAAFFDSAVTATGCSFAVGTPLHERVGVTDRQRLNVRLYGEDADSDGERDLLCLGGDGAIDEVPDVSCAYGPFETGGSPPEETGSVVVAHRYVSVDGRAASMEVRVW